MRRLRRASALLASYLMLHLVLVGSGFACVMPTMDAMHGMAMTGPGQTMAGMDMTSMPAAPGAPVPSTPAEVPCDFPWAPDGCQSTTPCAPAALATTALVVPVPQAAHGDVARLVVLTPPSILTPPELPPPRA